ncbi:hypothetical protein DTO027B5_4625 [Paecilomyces variotii]|nr:hypothetical protein DTO169C6_5835 [Paecilomyces variotii]KAJ9288450.1 hypothetical protein DTO021C3_3969 [Paecilomyces variotii]KAJ9320674.1 hypothetical protein DTO027B3_8318 [Paecilomyces variotii]KAJ9333638.1 hypothetical protein DTO027B5_4625 [Paecilomyces variotii]KAJ9398738.1 hypothetical protein DTO282F9_4321 [Paecilomyces variotii]
MVLPLPAIVSVSEAAEFGRTVWPFVPQLLSLPKTLIEVGSDWESLKEVYLATNPFVTAIAFTLALVPILVIISELNRNYSQVDRLWSILPSIYNVHYALWAHLAGLPTEKVKTVAIFSLIWSVRLTFNYWRKGGYKIGSEDYRWEIVRARVPSRFVWFLFNVLFISLVQSVLLNLITAPSYVFIVLSRLPEGSTFGIPDLVFSRVLIFFVIIEFFADQQQWKFHQAKKSYQQTARVPDEYKSQFTAEDLDRGFVVSGLWSLCRHPNFAAEQAIWLTLYLWDCYCTQTYVNWSGAGALSYLLLFQGSTNLTEEISANKYPEYKDYQDRVGRFIPRLSVEPRGSKRAPKSKRNSAETDNENRKSK